MVTHIRNWHKNIWAELKSEAEVALEKRVGKKKSIHCLDATKLLKECLSSLKTDPLNYQLSN